MFTTTTHEVTWELYGKAWSPVTAAARQGMLARTVDPDCQYADPTQACAGVAALAEAMHQFQQFMPGASFALTGFTVHHDQAMVSWNLLDERGKVVGTGTSFGRYNPDGRLVQMTGFFDGQAFLDQPDQAKPQPGPATV